jgi:hypothetical protein
MDTINNAIRLLYPYYPRPVSATRYATGSNTGCRDTFGNSIILQAASILLRKSLTVVIIPLAKLVRIRQRRSSESVGNLYF